MKLSYEWLKEYTDTGRTPEEIAGLLTMSGSEVGSVESVDGDIVMDLEITSNRPDCLNIIGLAREVAAVTGSGLDLPDMSIASEKQKSKSPALRCSVEDKDLCRRYTARVITGVEVKGAGGELKRRVTSIGMRAVNNIVDVTNFCLMETGQPLHAFDIDKIRGLTVIVRRAENNEKITTIDGVERTLKQGMLIIADASGPIAVAGIMGGKGTEVTSATKNILLESAYFDPGSVRRTARELGLSSDSSYRFERGVDPGMVLPASERAAGLILREAGGDPGPFYDIGSKKTSKTVIQIDTERIEKLLGVKIPDGRISGIMKSLGMSVGKGKGSRMKVTVPSFRADVRTQADLAEEVARIYGYHRIPESLPRSASPIHRKQHSRQVVDKIKQAMVSSGLNEIMTYSLISEKAVSNFNSLSDSPVKLKNPLSAEHEFLTPHLVDGMMRSVVWNINRGNKDLALFEVGKIYCRDGNKRPFSEKINLCLGMSGNITRDWRHGDREADVFALKGVLENLAGVLRVSLEMIPSGLEGFTCAGKVAIQGQLCGFIGYAAPEKLAVYGINQKVAVAQINIDAFSGKVRLMSKYEQIPRFPTTCRDISVLCEKALPARSIKKAIESAEEKMIRGIYITDMYEGEQIPKGRKSVTLSLRYGLPDRTLTDEEIEAAHSGIKDKLARELGISFR